MIPKENEFKDLCHKRGLSYQEIEMAVQELQMLSNKLCSEISNLEILSLDKIESYIDERTKSGTANEAMLIAYIRYYSMIKRDDVSIRLLSYLNPIGILPAMAEHLEALEGKKVREKVMENLKIPPIASKPEDYPTVTSAFTKNLEKEVGTVKAQQILAWNVHGIPAEPWLKEKEEFLRSTSLEQWLKNLHDRRVAEIEKHAIDGTLWFEQKITMRVVDYVRNNQEILSGVSDGRYIYATKIPFNPDGFLSASSDFEKRKYACHCPLAASSLNEKGADTPPLWCYCSAGFEKFIFDTVFDFDTKIEVLESVLAGDIRCRFRIEIPETVRKRFL